METNSQGTAMDEAAENRGAVFLCDTRGAILRVLRDDLGLMRDFGPGRLLVGLVDGRSTGKLLSFLVQVKTHGAAFNWEMNAPIGDQLTTLHFAGTSLEGQLVIFTARSRNGVLELFEEMMRISNEQANVLRAMIKEQSGPSRRRMDRNGELYDEISRLNNELVTLQRELSKKNMELERLNALKNQFLGMAAHDLRSPLGHILVYSEFLLDGAAPKLSEEEREFLTIIHSSSQFMLQLVTDLLDVAKIESGTLELDLQPTDLKAVLSRNVGLNRPLAAKKNIAIELFVEDPAPVVLVDRDRLEQVLNNLLGNAIKFSPPHTTITVTLVPQGSEVLISISDQGPGIPPEQLGSLFEPFRKGTAKGTAGERGSGLGLAIVKKIVSAHRGRVWVESAPGGGSTFRVALPIEDSGQ